MDEKFILHLGEGEDQVKLIIGQIIRMDNQKFFSLFNLHSGELLFGEYLGPLPEEEDLAREEIWNDFQTGCRNITYPDGHIMDDLFMMMDDLF